MCDGGKFEGEHVPYEFWDKYEIVNETPIDENQRGNFFTCSC
jgi:hypothetical protein